MNQGSSVIGTCALCRNGGPLCDSHLIPACGTPVIAWPNGSVPEIIEDGRTGFVVDTIDDAARAVSGVCRLRRADCRAAFLGRFNAARMASEYEKVYQRLAGHPQPPMQMVNVGQTVSPA
jgi:glycosyltransferase involved in cell wall biosynthesis